jgi:hypothetical protein
MVIPGYESKKSKGKKMAERGGEDEEYEEEEEVAGGGGGEGFIAEVMRRGSGPMA